MFKMTEIRTGAVDAEPSNKKMIEVKVFCNKIAYIHHKLTVKK